MSSAAMNVAPLLAALLRTSLEGAVLIALVALVVRAVPALPARLRCALWWAACLKLAAGFALSLAAGGGVELALLPPAAATVPGFAAAPVKIPAGSAAAPTPGSVVPSAADHAGIAERRAVTPVPSGPAPARYTATNAMPDASPDTSDTSSPATTPLNDPSPAQPLAAPGAADARHPLGPRPRRARPRRAG